MNDKIDFKKSNINNETDEDTSDPYCEEDAGHHKYWRSMQGLKLVRFK